MVLVCYVLYELREEPPDLEEALAADDVALRDGGPRRLHDLGQRLVVALEARHARRREREDARPQLLGRQEELPQRDEILPFLGGLGRGGSSVRVRVTGERGEEGTRGTR